MTEGRKWRQEKLYQQMTDKCIDEVAMPLRRLKLMPEELLTLKIIMLFNCGNHSYSGKYFFQISKIIFLEDNTLLICDTSRQKLIQSKNQIISALFAFYKSIDYKDFEGLTIINLVLVQEIKNKPKNFILILPENFLLGEKVFLKKFIYRSIKGV